MTNPLFNALVEGRYQIRVDIKEDATGKFHASHEAGGKIYRAENWDQSEAFREVEQQVREAIFAGEITGMA